MKVAAVIIARGGSRRLPRKNLLPFHGRALVAHKAWQLAQCLHVDHVVVGSDSDEILEAAAREGAATVRRTPEYCDEVSRPLNDVAADMASKVEADVILWAHCTNPCIRPETYDRAVKAYASQARWHDSLVGVCELRSHLWFHKVPLNYDPWRYPHRLAAQLEPVYWQNGGIFIYTREEMLRERYIFGRRPLLFPIDPHEAIDIDTQTDYERALAEFDHQERSTA